MLSWAAASGKLHIINHLIENDAMTEGTPDTWPALLETSNESLKKLQERYNRNLYDYELLMNEYVNFIRDITKDLQNDIQTLIIEDIQRTIQLNGGEVQQATIDAIQEIEITPEQDGKHADILGRLDQFGSYMQNENRILHETIEVNEFIKEQARTSEAKAFSLVASVLPDNQLSKDAVMHVTSFILHNKDTIKKIGVNFINNIKNQPPRKKRRTTGGKRKSKRKSKRKVTRKCRK